MSRMFVASIDVSAATTARDIVELIAPSGSPILIHELEVTTSVETDANEEQIPCELVRYTGTYTSGSGGTTATGYALGVGGATEDASTVETGNTTQAVIGTGAKEILASPFINNRIGMHRLVVPEAAITIDATDALVLAMKAAVTNSVAFGGHIRYEEIVA